MKEKGMTDEELEQLANISISAQGLATQILKLYGSHFANEEVMPLRRVHSALVEAEVGIKHFLMESKTATKWRKK